MFKKFSIANYLVCGAALLTLVALIVASCGGSGYPIDSIAWIAVCFVIGFLAAAASIFFSAFKGKALIAEILTYVMIVNIAVSIALLIGARGDLIGYIGVIHGPAEYQALNTFIGGIVLYVVAAVAMIVSACFRTVKGNPNN